MTALRTTITLVALALLTTGTALAGPPLATDDAATVAVGAIEMELNGSYGYDRNSANGSTSTLTTTIGEVKIATGLYDDLGLSLAIPYTFGMHTDSDGTHSLTSGIGDMTLEIKYGFLKLGGIQLAIKPQVVIPTGNYRTGMSEGHWHGGANLIATREFAEGACAVHANLGYEHHNYRTSAISSATHGDLWSGSLAGEARIGQGLTLVADVGMKTNPDKAEHELPAYALTGLRYELNDHLDVNAGIKFGITRPEADVTAIYGLVLKF